MVVSLGLVSVDEFDGWREAARERISARERTSGLRVGAEADARAERMLGKVFSHGYPADGSDLVRVLGNDGQLETLWVWRSGSRAVILDADLWERVRDEDLRSLRDLVREWAAASGAESLRIEAFRGDTTTWRFVQSGPSVSSSIQMILEPFPRRATTGDARIPSLMPMTPARFVQYFRESVDSFAESLLAAGGLSPEEAEKESLEQFEDDLPDGLDTPSQHLYTAVVDDTEVGILWFGIQDRADSRQAFIFDIEVTAELRGRGFGRAIMIAAENEAQRLGATSMGLHVFADNARAVRLYESLSYDRVQEYLFLP